MVNTIEFIVIIRFHCFVWLKIKKICLENKVTSVNMFIDVNIIGFNKIYRYAWRNGFLTFVLVVCYYSISFFIAFFLFLFFNLTFYLILLRSKIINFQILLSPLHSLHHYYSKSSTLWILHLPKNHLRKFNLCSKLKCENKISNFSDQMSMSQKKRKVLIDHPLWFLETLEMKVSLIF